MVHNITRYAKIPFSNAQTFKTHTKSVGQGMGSVLLQPGGGGSASSYMDVDDYIKQTGIDPYKRQTGSGLKSLSEKLSKLNLDTGVKKKLRKNITMSI